MKKFTPLLAICSAASLVSPLALASTQSDFNAQQQQAIKTIVHDYLVQNPEVLVEVSNVLQKKQMAAMQTKATEIILENKDGLFANSSDPVVGNIDGNVTLIEFFDYQCPHCVDMEPILQSLLKTNKNLRIVYKEFPIFGEVSNFASKAALAANKQGKYAAFHSALMNANKRLDQNIILGIAKDVGLDVTQLQNDMKDEQLDTLLRNNRTMAQKLQLMGTPAFIIGPTDTKMIGISNLSFIPGQVTEQELQQSLHKAE